jgi:photosystem II stability/assembly factor-like uncharacterized protein
MKNIFSIILILISPLAFCQWELTTPTDDSFDDFYIEVYFINKDTGFVIASIAEMEYEKVLLRTTNGMETWDTIRKSDIGVSPYTNFISIDFVNDTLGYISCQGDILKTENCGETWYSLDTADVLHITAGWYSILFVNKDTGFIAYQDGGAECLRTYDGGWTWEEDPVMTGARSFNEHNGIVTGCTGGWATLDLGSLEWTKGQGLLDNENVSGLNFYHSIYNNGQLILSGTKSASSAVYAVSEDNGETWRLYQFLGMLNLFEVDFQNDLRGFAAGSFGGTISTWDGGETWFLMEINNGDSEISKVFLEFSMVDENIGYGISNNGIYKTTNGGGEPISELTFVPYAFVQIDELGAKEFSIYPNPVGDFINVQSFAVNGNHIEIFDMAGQLVFSETVQSTQIDVSKLAAGQYNVRLYSENGNYSTSIIKK